MKRSEKISFIRGLLVGRKLFSAALALGLGVLTGHFATVSGYIWLAPCAAALAGAILSARARRTTLVMALVCAFAFFGGAAYLTLREGARPSFDSEREIEYSGVICAYPSIDTDGERFVCELKDARINGEEIGCRLRLYLRGGRAKLLTLAPGQTISGTGALFGAEKPRNPGEFDFGAHLWRDGIGGYISAKYSKAHISGEETGLSAWLYRANADVGAKIDELFGDNADIVRALLLGDASDIDADMRRAFSLSGVAHLLAISGLHIMLIASAINFLLKRLVGLQISTVVTIVLIIFYAVFIGPHESVRRAVVMYAVFSTAPLFGRNSDSPTRLAAAFALLLLINPMSMFSPGFVLSFSASAGLIFLSAPILRATRLRISETESLPRRLWKSVLGSVATVITAQIATMPAVAVYYNRLPVLAALSNVFIVPFTLVILLLSLFSVLTALAFSPLGAVSLVPDAMITLLKTVIGYVSEMPLGNITVADPPWWICALFFASALAASGMNNLTVRARTWLMPLLPAIFAVGMLVSGLGGEIVFLDVGQGDAAVARDGRSVICVDTGVDGTEVADYVNSSGYYINALFLSHPHDDHAGGLNTVLEECPPGVIYVPVGWDAHIESEEVFAATELARDMGIDIVELAAGDELEIGGARISVLSPERGKTYTDNEASLVFLYSANGVDALFTGDASAKTAVDVDILKVSHHGSNGSTRATFIELAEPEYAVISVGRNTYGHPGSRVLDMLNERGAEIFRTDERGAVIAEPCGDGVKVYGFCD